jgi:hypothetical protein
MVGELQSSVSAASAILPDLRKHLKVAQRLQQEERTASVSDESKSR